MPRGVPQPRFTGMSYTQDLTTSGVAQVVVTVDVKAAVRVLNRLQKTLVNGMDDVCAEARRYMRYVILRHISQGLELRGGTKERGNQVPTPMKPLREWTKMNKQIQGSTTPNMPMKFTGRMIKGIETHAFRDPDGLTLTIAAKDMETQRKIDAHMFPDTLTHLTGSWYINIYKLGPGRPSKDPQRNIERSKVVSIHLKKITQYSRHFLFIAPRELHIIYAKIDEGITRTAGLRFVDERAASFEYNTE